MRHLGNGRLEQRKRVYFGVLLVLLEGLYRNKRFLLQLQEQTGSHLLREETIRIVVRKNLDVVVILAKDLRLLAVVNHKDNTAFTLLRYLRDKH